jgi:hypothetical protein
MIVDLQSAAAIHDNARLTSLGDFTTISPVRDALPRTDGGIPLRLAILYSCLLLTANMLDILLSMTTTQGRAPAEMIEVEVISVTTG